MAKTTDILLDEESLDLKIKNGDFEIGDADYQNMHQIVLAGKGDFKQWPVTGADIREALNSSRLSGSLRNKIEQELKRDGYTVRVINFQDGALNIDATRESNEETNTYADLRAVPKGLWDYFWIEIEDEEGQVDPNQFKRIYMTLATNYMDEQPEAIQEQFGSVETYAHPDEDGYMGLEMDGKLIKARVDDSVTDFLPGLVRASFWFEPYIGSPRTLEYLPVCFVIP